MLMQLRELLNKADIPLFVDRWFAGDPLRLNEGVLNVVQARSWPVNLGDLVR